MNQQILPTWPFSTEVLDHVDGTLDTLPAAYHCYEYIGGEKKNRIVVNPANDPPNSVSDFLDSELSLGDLGKIFRYLRFAGSKYPATQLHLQAAMGREITVADRMDLHLLWDNNSKIFFKPIPRFLLDPGFWRRNLMCPGGCACEKSEAAATNGGAGGTPANQEAPAAPCKETPRRVALGFLYTYACLVTSESDFFVANDKRLLPRQAEDKTIEWATWKELVRELLETHDPDMVHPRFLRSELRLSRINTISRFTSLPSFDPYLRGWRNYGSFFRDNLAWMATAAVFIALVLTAMQVGLATERLQSNADFQRASYGFTIFAILGPMCAFGLAALGALLNLVKDLPWLVGDKAAQPRGAPAVSAKDKSPLSPV
ncbi:hypothetical protein Sste5346_005454 [Sporothrix stenoceras]|uniref:Subtilisin-like serine protease n=1 Tax=Sporothrix stenoceras TaxID=5173 RepID=A0ABR3Z472_9PEZI